ncbi:hypothetical protein EV363DRAFT_1403477 [Boletus edulis]|nr:hypothetical protein EV363DRAFT_1403477 [Boletus edulis]
MSMKLYVCHQGGEFNSEPEARRNRVERELRKSVAVTFRAEATKQNGNGCEEQEEVPMCMPAERDRESLEGCLCVTEWWSNSRSCHRMSEDAAETGSEEVQRWAVKRTGEQSKNRKNVEQSSRNPGKGPSQKRESTELMSGAPEMDGAAFTGCANVLGDIGDDTRGDIRDKGDNRRCRNDTNIGGLGGRQKMTSGLAFRLQESGKVAAHNLIRSTDRIEGIRQEVSNGREGRWSTITKLCKSGVPPEVQRTQQRRQSVKGGMDEDLHEVRIPKR